MRSRLVLLLAVLVLPAVLVPVAGGFRAEGRPWPHGTIKIHNAAADQEWAVRQALEAWNGSGARVRFVRVGARDADVTIRSLPRRTCTHAYASFIGYRPGASIWIFQRRDTHLCNHLNAALAVAHELGHVLGLAHEQRSCAAMNAAGALRGPQLCPRVAPWEWHCRILEPDDVAGAVALYGGRVRPRGARGCPLYTPISHPTGVGAGLDAARGVVTVSLVRPRPPVTPRWLATGGHDSFALAWGPRDCSLAYDASLPHYRWDVEPGARRELTLRAPGAACLAIWAVDGLGRPSRWPALVTVG
ncbi:MAG TPA: hypothetical protein VM204_07915 [Gaiellaceae bacterium]|nr:hypothetical protein [Gaiellaceae bacterium]